MTDLTNKAANAIDQADIVNNKAMGILAISWRLYFISSIIGLCSLVFLVLAVLGIVNAANGRAKELPVIGKFKFLK